MIVVITVPQGPTIMDDDQKPVTITRMAATEAQRVSLLKAAEILGATSIEMKQDG